MPDIDKLIENAIFSTDPDVKSTSRQEIRELASTSGAHLCSLHTLYMAVGRYKVGGFTVPAINIRTLTYDIARTVFRLAMENKVGAFIFEIARSEMKYTEQDPDEYAVAILAAALKEGYRGEIYVQGDHYQVNKELFDVDRDKEIYAIKELIEKSIKAGFYNIDIDASTLVALGKESKKDQQRDNYEVTAELSKFIRSIEPEGVTVSIGGEIGHIGGVNSTTSDFEAFMDGYLPLIGSMPGISKVSVQTGTSHGGTVMSDGTLAKVNLDFDVISSIGDVARKKYGIGGAVQHGASTLPNELFGEFVKANTLEIHLATGFQNIVFDNLPDELKQKMIDWVKTNLMDEKSEEMNEEQFVYKLRKKAFGPFKKELWHMNESEMSRVMEAVEKQLVFLFEKLRISNTLNLIKPYAR